MILRNFLGGRPYRKIRPDDFRAVPHVPTACSIVSIEEPRMIAIV
jgi:hypothetical protein